VKPFLRFINNPRAVIHLCELDRPGAAAALAGEVASVYLPAPKPLKHRV
jgi:hypothetical protein